MKTLVFALLGMPLLSWVTSGATVYTFTLQTVRGPIGFTYVAPESLTQTSTYVNSWMLAGCDTTGAPGWVCVDAYLRQTTIEGRPVVQITLDLVYPPGLGDGFATDQLNESFPGASLESAGSYPGFLSPSILSVSGPADNFLTAASSSRDTGTETPEP